jgi:exopolysaccharide biosynthesis WecB/TagA/CpsF family protein
VVGEIRRAGPGLLYVGLGNPLQERWLAAHLPSTGARLGVGVGAFLDFQAGEMKRAPGWMNRAGVEWVHRLALEPQRMWRRYVYGNPRFIYRVLRQRAAGGLTRLPDRSRTRGG